ncbi:probable ATP-dependent RNA helicase DDX60 isoform X2 [Tachyglossus aculeatus]|uniref:probable ATP-dependent RNA helicase DDX60 isoform X2 n=1 Tax=Tachyglossus aculeatus TaxID=9261 RepID=UPI0018F7935E|nr:probable ATP-dependent RNA helicase DDX60 isoform X2 [Tachyglossus aculeatus]
MEEEAGAVCGNSEQEVKFGVEYEAKKSLACKDSEENVTQSHLGDIKNPKTVEPANDSQKELPKAGKKKKKAKETQAIANNAASTKQSRKERSKKTKKKTEVKGAGEERDGKGGGERKQATGRGGGVGGKQKRGGGGGSKVYSEFLNELSETILNEIPKAEYSSLLSDFVESEYFLFDGDSLLLSCICEKSLAPGQNLHFFFLVERYLADLTNKGAQFVIIFFQDTEEVYFKFPQLLLLRTTLILHLKHNAAIDVRTEFSSCLSPEWKCFLEEKYPYFLIIADNGLNDLQTNFLNISIIQAWSMKVNVVLISDQASDTIRVYGYILQSMHRHHIFFAKNRAKLGQVYQSLIKDMEDSSEAALVDLFGGLSREDIEQEAREITERFRCLWPEGIDIRSNLCITSCSLALRMYYYRLSGKTEMEESEQLTLQEVADLCRMHCLSVACLLHLPLVQRARMRIITSKWTKPTDSFWKMKQWCEFFTLKMMEFLKFSSIRMDEKHLPDLSDHLLLKSIAYYFEVENSQGLHLDLGEAIQKDYECLWGSISMLVDKIDVGRSFPLRTTTKHFLQQTKTPIKELSNGKMPDLGFIPVTSSVVDAFAGDILKNLSFLSSKHPVVMSLVKLKEFDELRHWHSGKRLSDDYDRTRGSLEENTNDPHLLRKKQRFREYQQFYGQTLEVVTPKVIVTQTAKAMKNGNKTKDSKRSQESKQSIIVRENQKRLDALKEQKEQDQWIAESSGIKRAIEDNFSLGVSKLDEFLKKCKTDSVKFNAEKVGLTYCLKAWKRHCKEEGKISKDLSIAAQVMRRLQSLVCKYEEFLKKKDCELIVKCLKYLGFDNLVEVEDFSQEVNGDRTEKKKATYSVDMGSARFQLLHMGHFLMRNERTDPDPRVQGFIPDTWQRELLDVVDNNESAVIVAPTSSGKTYASYYCIERVLKESDEGVVIYVAPTKALVNQVSATVLNRFTKRLPVGQALCGTFTRDYRQDVLNCQVLVTVPACLEILLLSPHRQAWVKRIRYVIFDEVHCLGGEIGAEVWEHLLVMIRCPFLALSATISNPEHLTRWLQSVKTYWRNADKIIDGSLHSDRTSRRGSNVQKQLFGEKRSYKVRLVLYGERYNHLEKYVCSFKGDDIVTDRYHPCAALTTDHIKEHGFPSDLTLSPHESLQLYDMMVSVWERWPHAQKLNPEEFQHFKDKIAISRVDARKYEESLKKELKKWIEHGHEKKVRQVLNNLKPNCVPCSQEMMVKFPLLVEKLRKMDKLPALFFIFKITDVELRANEVYKSLEEKQQEQQSPNAEKEASALDKRLRKVTKSIEKQPEIHPKPISKADQYLVQEAEFQQLLQKLEELKKVPENCTYASLKVIKSQTLFEVFRQVKFTSKSEELQTLALRGIGYHHSALNFRGRQLVEILFRKGLIRVVTATGTLALGINMPCKSVIFAQNSIYLDALNYRQVLSVLKHSLLTFSRPRAMEMLKIFFLFSLQFLVKEGYLDRECNPMGFAGLVSHLHYHEPANFLLVSFLVKGLLHKLCTPIKEGSPVFSEDVMEKLVLVLANLFGRKYILAKYFEAKRNFQQSKVFLEDLPKDFEAAVCDYNTKIKKDFCSFIRIVSKLADMKQEYQLPLSKIDFTDETSADSALVSHLMSCKEGRTAVSPFVCLSGYTDRDLLGSDSFSSVVLQSIGVNDSLVPVLDLKKYDSRGRRMPLNAYALDFYKHGSITALSEDNGLHRGEVFLLLKDFLLTIQSISVSLSELCEKEDDNVVLAFKQLSSSFKARLDKVND